jgi:hypothetical protein
MSVVISLEHVSLEAKDAESICNTANRVLERYGIGNRVNFVVTDTAAVMVAAVKRMGKIWSPCWAHILNLMLGAMVGVLQDDFLGSVLQMAGRLSRTWRWSKILAHYEGYTVASIPTYSPTRWYSLAKLLAHTLKLREPIEEFFGGSCPLVSSWDKVMTFERVVSTFANATAYLESEEFGTFSRVYEWLYLIKKSALAAAVDWQAMTIAWAAAEEYIKENVGPNEGEESDRGRFLGSGVFLNNRVLVATFLNPATLPGVVLSPGNFRSGQNMLMSLYAAKKIEAPLGNWSGMGGIRQERAVDSPRRKGRESGLTLEDFETGLQREEQPIGELERFLVVNRAELRPELDGFDVLDWWNRHQASFPLLYQLALEYLSVPASSAAIERQFSKAKLVHSDRRQSLTPERLAGMVLLREHIDLVDPLDESSDVRREPEESIVVFSEDGNESDGP